MIRMLLRFPRNAWYAFKGASLLVKGLVICYFVSIYAVHSVRPLQFASYVPEYEANPDPLVTYLVIMHLMIFCALGYAMSDKEDRKPVMRTQRQVPHPKPSER